MPSPFDDRARVCGAWVADGLAGRANGPDFRRVRNPLSLGRVKDRLDTTSRLVRRLRFRCPNGLEHLEHRCRRAHSVDADRSQGGGIAIEHPPPDRGRLFAPEPGGLGRLYFIRHLAERRDGRQRVADLNWVLAIPPRRRGPASAAFSRALASFVFPTPPSPISSRRQRQRNRKTHRFAPPLSTTRYRPPPSAWRPGVVMARTPGAVSLLVALATLLPHHLPHRKVGLYQTRLDAQGRYGFSRLCRNRSFRTGSDRAGRRVWLLYGTPFVGVTRRPSDGGSP